MYLICGFFYKIIKELAFIVILSTVLNTTVIKKIYTSQANKPP